MKSKFNDKPNIRHTKNKIVCPDCARSIPVEYPNYPPTHRETRVCLCGFEFIAEYLVCHVKGMESLHIYAKFKV